MASTTIQTMDRRMEKDEAYRRELMILFKDLRSMAVSGMEYFRELKGPNNEKFHSSFNDLYEHLERGIEPAVDYLTRVAHTYDYDAATPGNGYRSIVDVVHKCALHILQLCRYITLNRESFLFRGGHYSRELNAYVTTLGQLRACLFYLQKLSTYTSQGELTPNEEALSEEEYKTAERLMIEVENLSQETFYGRCLGFQYCASLRKPLATINLVMASFSEGYYNHSSTVMKFANSIIGGSKYMMDPELRAQRVVNVTRNGDINFCKAFWQINESSVMHNLPLFICPPVHVDKVIVLPPKAFELPLADESGNIGVTVPCAHTGPGPVNTRLISYELREGQEGYREPTKSSRLIQISPKSHGLLFHIHGGGFVAQSSASHEVYLRHWAKELNVPILSVDYSLAPENPFPRQLEEAFFAYCWAVKNIDKLGSTGERICLAGDSAGGNLAVAIAMRAKDYGIRQPDGILSTYGSMLVKYTPSPSRILALMDPLLPIGILSKCLAAYAGIHVDGGLHFPKPCSSEFGSALLPEFEQSSAKNSESPDSGCVLVDREENSAEGAAPSTAPKVIRHKQTKSGDSGFHDDLTEEGDEENKEERKACFTLHEDDEEDEGSKPISQLVNQIKEGADHVDAEQKCRHSVLFEQLKQNPMKHSPSQPVFSTFSEHPEPRASNTFGSPPHYAHMKNDATSPMEQFHHMPLSKNPYMSPLLASDEQLVGLCPVYLVACQLDPILDDSIMFARRLRTLKQPVHLDILPDLPHGFLNFALISPEAKKASELCVARMLEVLELEDDYLSDVGSDDLDPNDEQLEVVGGTSDDLLR